MEGRSLEDVLGTVDGTVLHPAVLPPGATALTVSGVVILDWTDPHGLHPGALVLAVGVEPERPAAATLVDRAAAAAVAAVVVRCDGELPRPLADAAERAGVALLAAPLGAAWGQLYALLRTALESSGVAPGAGTSGLPVGDLFSLADAIATAVGGAITIEDPQWRVLAYSNLGHEIDEPRRHTILGRAQPEEWQERMRAAGVAQELRRTEGVVRFEFEGIRPRVAAPIRAGGELLGSVWLAAGEDVAADAEDQLVRAAEISAMHLIAHRAGEDLKRRARGASVRETLEGHAPVGHRGPALPLTVVAFDAQPGGRTAWAEASERILSVSALFAEATHRDAMCALVDERVWVLVPGDGAPERLLAMAERVVDRVAETLGVELMAVVTPAAERVRDVPAARAAAERALAVLGRRPGPPHVVLADALRASAILDEWFELAVDRPALRRGPLFDAAVRPRDRVHLESLRVYLAEHGDVARAAERLDVHPNTLRYRLRRLAETLGIDLRDPDERLVCELQLRMIERGTE